MPTFGTLECSVPLASLGNPAPNLLTAFGTFVTGANLGNSTEQFRFPDIAGAGNGGNNNNYRVFFNDNTLTCNNPNTFQKW